MSWRLVVTRPAEKDLDKLPVADREGVRRALERLLQGPGSVDLTKLGGHEDEWRMRVGRWRVRLLFDNTVGVIYVLRVLPRSTAYRD
jgi:mRNA interferase RelE/StbE